MLELALGLTLAGLAAAAYDRFRRTLKTKPIPVRVNEDRRRRSGAK
ncbi:MAG TPA: hypothetical protein VNA88_18730 [Candidatus Kapabacteria bacterium]|jgi:hypothetical protein|nr:hypothetical protein [Candidatus Kapabacteria bacterium]